MTRPGPRKPGKVFASPASKVREVRCGRPRCGRELAALFDETTMLPGLALRPDLDGPAMFICVVQPDGTWGPVVDLTDPTVFNADLAMRCPKHGAVGCAVQDVLNASGPTFLV